MKTYKYFVSFAMKKGYGYVVIDTQSEIKNEKDILKIHDKLSEEHGEICLINWIKL